jgi:hypothetical protein
LRLAKLRRHLLEHREAARDLEAADRDRKPGGPERAGEVERPVVLVGPDSDQADQRLRAAAADPADQGGRIDMGVGLVDREEPELDVRAEDPALGAVAGDAVQGGERIGRMSAFHQTIG